jgi:hypothetical protein
MLAKAISTSACVSLCYVGVVAMTESRTKRYSIVRSDFHKMQYVLHRTGTKGGSRGALTVRSIQLGSIKLK